MNGKMWLHPATQQNVATLRARGANLSDPRKECSPADTKGIGRLWNVDEIVAKADEILLRGPDQGESPRVESTKKIKRKSKKIR